MVLSTLNKNSLNLPVLLNLNTLLATLAIPKAMAKRSEQLKLKINANLFRRSPHSFIELSYYAFSVVQS